MFEKGGKLREILDNLACGRIPWDLERERRADVMNAAEVLELCERHKDAANLYGVPWEAVRREIADAFAPGISGDFTACHNKDEDAYYFIEFDGVSDSGYFNGFGEDGAASLALDIIDITASFLTVDGWSDGND